MSHFKSITNPGGISHCAIQTGPRRMQQDKTVEKLVDRVENLTAWWALAVIGWQAVIAAVLGVMLRVALEGGV